MGLFSKKEEPAKPLDTPATIVLTVNSIPSHEKASYSYDVKINGKTVGSIHQNGVPATYIVSEDKVVLQLFLNIRLNNGDESQYASPKQKIDLASGETVRVKHENRKFTVER